MSKNIAIVAALAALVVSPIPSEARSYPARSGSSAFPEFAHCWAPFGSTVTNTCSEARHWYVPILFSAINFPSGSVSAWTVVEGAFLSNNVSCRLTGSNLSGTAFSFSQNANLTAQITAFGSPFVFVHSVVVPDGLSGAVSVDCLVNPGGKIHVTHQDS